ncbi:gag-like protein [Gracilaria domingensis]|nr:gag-like protein [Gracilaria domingensis]
MGALQRFQMAEQKLAFLRRVGALDRRVHADAVRLRQLAARAEQGDLTARQLRSRLQLQDQQHQRVAQSYQQSIHHLKRELERHQQLVQSLEKSVAQLKQTISEQRQQQRQQQQQAQQDQEQQQPHPFEASSFLNHARLLSPAPLAPLDSTSESRSRNTDTLPFDHQNTLTNITSLHRRLNTESDQQQQLSSPHPPEPSQPSEPSHPSEPLPTNSASKPTAKSVRKSPRSKSTPKHAVAVSKQATPPSIRKNSARRGGRKKVVLANRVTRNSRRQTRASFKLKSQR